MDRTGSGSPRVRTAPHGITVAGRGAVRGVRRVRRKVARPAARAVGEEVAVIRVLVVVDASGPAARVDGVLNAEPDLDVVGTLIVESDLTVRAERLRPQVIVFDTGYMVSQVLPIAADLRARIPGCSLLLLSD